MAHYDIYRQQLALNFHAFGHALWEPSPGESYGQVEIGDVGFIKYGKFHRIFNVMLSKDHSTHANFGTPEDHEPLKPRMQKHIDTGELSPNDFYSGEVKVISGGLNVFSSQPEGSAQASFTCSRKQGAILSLPVPARREDTFAQGQFREWMIKHIDCWFAFFQSLKLGIECMEDIVLVTGLHRTLSCTNVVFIESSDGAQVSFGIRVASGDSGTDIRWQFSREPLRRVLMNRGPSGNGLHENQCIFVRGLRATRFLGIFPTKFQAAAGPSQLEDPNAHDPRSDKQLISIPSSSSYQEPLHILLKYIAEREPNCDMALVHDDDLGCISSSLLDSLDPDTFMDFLRLSHPLTSCHNMFDDEGSSKAGPYIRVATLSEWVFNTESPSPSASTSPTDVNQLVHDTESMDYDQDILTSMGPPRASTSRPKAPVDCPICGDTFHRKADWGRHVLSKHFPEYIQCPEKDCSWRGSRKEELTNHLDENGHGQGDTEQDREQYEIYDTRLILDLVRKGSTPFEVLRGYVDNFVKERARELGKEELWGITK